MFVFRNHSRHSVKGSTADRPRPGRPRPVQTISKTKNVAQRIRRNPARSMRKMAKEMKMSRESMRRLVREDLGMKAYKLQKRQLTKMQSHAFSFHQWTSQTNSLL